MISWRHRGFLTSRPGGGTITEWKWIDILTRQFELCHAGPGQQVVVLAESGTASDLLITIRIALQRTGAPSTELILPSLQEPAGARDALKNSVVWAALSEADLVIDCTNRGIDTSARIDDLLDTDTRILVIGTREPTGIERYIPHPGLESRVERGIKLLEDAERLELSDPRGTKLTIKLAKAEMHGSWGSVTDPGTSDRWPSGFFGAVPAEDTVSGILVVMPGDINLSIHEFVHSPVTIAIDDDHISEIEGESGDADIIRTHLEAFDDVAAYGFSAIDIGMNHSTRHDKSELYERSLLDTTEARITAGFVTLTFGTNPVAGRVAPGTFMVCLRRPTMHVDGVMVIDAGKLVGELAPDVYETAAS